MTAEKFKRKLTAILSADVKGYSRLMGEDEEGTLRTLSAYKELMAGFIQHHRGRVVSAAGDSVLAEFGSVVAAIQCAVEIQKELKSRNADVPENRRMEFRIGINLGDVVEEGDSIYGDGVNIASRVQGLAEGGGICISGTVYDHIKNKLALGYEYAGEQVVKNIKEPVRIYRVLMEPGVKVPEVAAEKKAKPRQWQRLALSLGVILIVIVAAIAVWRFYLRPTSPPREIASKEKMAFPLPDKPSIAVLPFVNMSKDPDQEYFSDGMTEDLITDLSKISGLLVIARNSTFTYKGKPVKVKQVAEELGVRYVLEGSVRRAGDEIRINAQLIDAMTGHHLWAERYDGTMGKIFALQDQITHKIVSALAVKLTGSEKELVSQKGTEKVAAYEEFLKGWVNYLRMTPDDLVKAVQSFKKATELDPNYGRAYAALALAYWHGGNVGSTLLKGLEVSWFESRFQARQYLKQAMKNPTSIAHLINSQYYLFRRQHEEAVSELERAIALDPNDPSCNAFMGAASYFIGKPKEAVGFINRAMRLDPHNPARYLTNLGAAQFCMGNLEEAATLLGKGLRLNPELSGSFAFLAATYGLLGREQEARAAMETHVKGWPPGIAPNLFLAMYFFPIKERAVADRLAEGLIKAGMPGRPSGYFHASKENQLTGKEIEALLFGSTITGIDAGTGQQWWFERKKDGQTTSRGAFGSNTGRTWIEGDMSCTQMGGMEYCMTTFRNPNGTREGMDEYINFSDNGIARFSVMR